jgi:hypothetical protein
MRQTANWKKRLDPAIKHGMPIIYVAPIAAGEKVVASKLSATAGFIKEHYSDAL